jgi:ankyrin repeat protein
MALVGAIAANDRGTVTRLLQGSPVLARARIDRGATRQEAREYYVEEVGHYLYAGDTALHVAAAGYRVPMVVDLVSAGADVAAANRRGAQALHYAADGRPGSLLWGPEPQRETIVHLMAAGSDPNAVDKGGVTPLHRAIRCRCASGVNALLEGGADPRRPNGSGTSPMELALMTTGRGGSGSPAAKSQQAEIVRLLEEYGAK